MARFVASFDHLIILLLERFLHFFFIFFTIHCLEDCCLDFLDVADLGFILSSSALHVADVLDNRALDLVEQLQCWLAVDFTAADSVGDMDPLDLIAKRVQQFVQIERFSTLFIFTASATTRLLDHRLRALSHQHTENGVINIEL